MLSTEQNSVVISWLPYPNFSTRAEQYYRLILLQWKHHREHASVSVIFHQSQKIHDNLHVSPLCWKCAHFVILFTFPCSGCLYSGHFRNYECASLWQTHTSSNSSWLWFLTETSTSITSAKYWKYPPKEFLFLEYRSSQHLRSFIQTSLLLLPSLDVRGNNMKFIHKALHIWLTEKVFNIFSRCKSFKIFLLEKYIHNFSLLATTLHFFVTFPGILRSEWQTARAQRPQVRKALGPRRA